jgi:uncharacterized protein
MKMMCLTIRIKRNDETSGKRVDKLLIDFLMQNNVAGVTVWTGVDGFGKRRRSTLKLEGVTINMPMIIEIMDERSKLTILPQIKRMVDDNGIVSLHEVEAI